MKLLLIVVVGIGVRVGLGMKAFLQFRAPTNMTVVTGPASPTVHRTLPDREGSAKCRASAHLEFATRLETWRAQYESAELCVVTGVGSRIVLFHVNATVTHAANRTPAQVPEMHDEVGWNVAHRTIDLLRLKHPRSERAPLPVSQALLTSVLSRRGRPHNLCAGNHTSGLTSLDIQEDSRIISAFAPDFRPSPIYF